jgi:hypothetical protein
LLFAWLGVEFNDIRALHIIIAIPFEPFPAFQFRKNFSRCASQLRQRFAIMPKSLTGY